MARGGESPLRDEEPEPVVQPAGDLVERQDLRARRGELDRERQPVELAADPRGRLVGRRIERQAVPRQGRPVDQQPHRLARAHAIHVVAGVRHGHRRHRVRSLAGDVEDLAAGREDPEVGHRLEQVARDLRRGLPDVLAVVEHEQHVAATQGIAERGVDRRAGELSHAQRQGDVCRNEVRIRHRDEVDDHDGIDHIRRRAPRALEGQPRLPDPADADERDEA